MFAGVLQSACAKACVLLWTGVLVVSARLSVAEKSFADQAVFGLEGASIIDNRLKSLLNPFHFHTLVVCSNYSLVVASAPT